MDGGLITSILVSDIHFSLLSLLFFPGAALGPLFLLFLYPNGDHGIYGSSFACGEGHQIMRENVQFMESVISQIGFGIALFN
jgi:hypothetical protein